MQGLTEQQIRRAIVNCTRGEAAAMALPRGLAGLDWAALEFLGWRDAKAPLRGYLVYWREGRPVGILLRAAESRMSRRSTALCGLCRTSHSANNVSLFATRRGGAAGRAGNTIGTYICADLACPRHIRVPVPTPSLRPDPGRTVEERAAGLASRLDTFLDEVLATT